VVLVDATWLVVVVVVRWDCRSVGDFVYVLIADMSQ
jgi:hypothetical protein